MGRGNATTVVLFTKVVHAIQVLLKVRVWALNVKPPAGSRCSVYGQNKKCVLLRAYKKEKYIYIYIIKK